MKATVLIKIRIEFLREEIKRLEDVCSTTKNKYEFEACKENLIYYRGALFELEDLLDDLE